MQDEKLRVEVEKALDTVRPHLEEDGGNVEVVDITLCGELQIRWLGTCRSCNMSEMTLRAGIEQAVLQKIPQIKKVKAVL
ncbi:MAG: NifU family protein [Saprospirales bacterium]|nr:MAG: NifU family protein [Saprospirales bacterium]